MREVTSNEAKPRSFTFPKQFRLLRKKDFRRVYEEGTRVAGSCFVAFCLDRKEAGGPRVGFTVPRALGKAVERNRIKRRLREAVRTRLWKVGPQWDIVFNARRAALEAPWSELEREVERVLRRCRAS